MRLNDVLRWTGSVVLWTGGYRPFSKHSVDQLAICSLFDKDSHFSQLDPAALR